jgi:hypothetical protein
MIVDSSRGLKLSQTIFSEVLFLRIVLEQPPKAESGNRIFILIA